MQEPNSLNIRIVDFGISGLYTSNINSEKSRAGSLKYMAPEILTGANTSADPALDMWSLGCILYFLVIGEHPFSAESRQMILKKIIELPVKFKKNTKISKQCRDLIKSMLNKS